MDRGIYIGLDFHRGYGCFDSNGVCVNEASIKLAKAMDYCQGPLSEVYEVITNKHIFDPFTDDGDCVALAAFMRTKQITVTISIGRGVRFDHVNGTKTEWEGEDWKQGVCELALEALGIKMT